MDSRLILQAKLELARREFFFYCCLRAPDFYKPERAYLRELCDALQVFYEGEDEVLVINEPPRHGKSRTAGLFVEWILGRNPKEKIMTGSYNETLSTVFSKNVRNSIQEIKADTSRIVYSDIFPGVTIKAGDAAMNLWSLAGGYNSYVLNDKLRRGVPFTDFERKCVLSLDSALDKMPRYEGVLQRSLDFRDEESLQIFLDEHSVGRKRQYPSYISMTASEESYNPRGQVQIFVLQSSKGRDIRAYNAAEQEVLYPRNSRFLVKQVEVVGGQFHIYLEEITDG